jgi:pimeloyl-ACP methyl ester carboxylesterase
MKTYFSFFLFLFSCFINAQELARRPFLGIQMEKVSDDTKRIMELPSVKGVLVKGVIAASSAEKAGFLPGDVLLKLNDTEVNSPSDAIKTVASYQGGDEFSYELIRKGKTMKGKSKFKPAATETYNNITMHYTATKSVAGVQRLIISQPKTTNAKSPAVIFIGGIGCYSLDTPSDTGRSEIQLLNLLSRSGYVCVRVEKPGVGDNMKCTPCAEVSFMDELDGYINAIKTVKTYSYVDTNAIFIVGHSMGGVMAPLAAQQTKIKGIIAYGTIGSNFMEYLLKTRRTIGEAYQWNKDETDEYIKDYCECAAYYFVEKMTTEEAAKKKEVCKDYLSVFDYRSRKYNDQLYDLNIPAAWKKFGGKALLLWGETDYIASKEDHEIIVETVNHEHPGNAQFNMIAKSTHGIQYAETFQQARTSPGAYNPTLAKTILDWLNKIS